MQIFSVILQDAESYGICLIRGVNRNVAYNAHRCVMRNFLCPHISQKVQKIIRILRRLDKEKTVL
jgi:hypothetical protein